MGAVSIIVTRWELAFTLLDKLDRKQRVHVRALGISIHPS